MSGYQPQGYDPRQQRPATPPQWGQSEPPPQWGQPEPPPYNPNPALTGYTGQRQAPAAPQQEPRGRSPVYLYAGIALIIGIAIGGAAGYALHGSTPAGASTGNAAAAATTPTAPAAPATPDTAAAAKSAAGAYFALYSAGQWQATWQRLATADQKIAPEKLYVEFHDACPSEAAGLAYKIESVTMAGKAAVITYTIPVLEKLFGSATITEDWTASGWRQEFTSGSASEYQHGSLKADVAAAKAAGECASS